MRLGLLTAAFGERPLADVAGWATEAGFDALEVYCPPGREPEVPGGIAVSALAYYPNNLDPDLAAREAAHAHLRQVIDAAAQLGVGLVCTFAGADPGKPLAAPALAVTAIFAFQRYWNAFLWPLIVLQSPDLFTLQVGLSFIHTSEFGTNYGLLMAGASLAAVPMIVFFFAFQRYFMQGLRIGAVKG